MSSRTIRDSVERALDGIRSDGAKDMMILRLDEAARHAGDAADALRRSGSASPLLGTLVTIKDNFDLADHATTAGSTLLADAPPAQSDAVAVERLRRAGCVILGRTNMTEFAFSGLGLNPHYGTPANPAFVNEYRTPGGSSSGAAVSVALGIVPVALGTDTGGSIRIPAAFCGLVGFKPSASAISREGVLPLSTTLDTIGVIARSVADCAGMFDVLRDVSGPGPGQGPRRGRASLPARRIRIGLVENYVTNDVSPEVGQGFDKAVAALVRGGISIEPIRLPELDELPATSRLANFSAVESYGWHEPYLAAGAAPRYDPRVLARIMPGADTPAPAYATLIARRQAMIRSVAARIAGLDALLWPTVPIVAPTMASLASDEAYHATNLLVLRNPAVVNFLDGCAISLPCPVEGAPVGLSLAALNGQDDHLLSVAACAAEILKG
ncbi:amidase [Sphingomonas sp.]|uniref:amidase n=1 Tax=Sphingomonas sp. TaxID=28214 RepID=UPI002FC72077